MRGHLMRNFELAAVLEIGGVAGSAEGLAADLRLDGRKLPQTQDRSLSAALR
jgi:hypothetical protein